MAVLPRQVNMDNRTHVPLYRVQRYGMPQPSDFFTGPPFRNIHGPPRELYLSDLRDSRHYPNVMTMNYEGFRVKIKLSLCFYKPEDVKVELQDNYLVIEAKHEERKEKHCYVSREFKRRINLPQLAIADEVNGKMSQGWLSVYIPLKQSHYIPEFYCAAKDPRCKANHMGKPQKVRTVPIRNADF